jgi:hypothetical protein
LLRLHGFRFILNSLKHYGENRKKYIASCIASVCDTDAEMAECMLRMIDFHTESVVEGMKRISELPGFSQRGRENASKHILRSYRDGNISDLEHRIWVAQIQVLFPIIELERVNFVRQYETEIQNVLQNHNITQYGTRLYNAEDVELGSFCYMMHERDTEGNYLLYIPNESDRYRIKFLHTCRNLLAHTSLCTPSQVKELIG